MPSRVLRTAALAVALAHLGATSPLRADDAPERPSTAIGRATTAPSDWPDTLAAHGGPVKSVAVAGTRALTASFDYAANLWDLSGDAPRVVHRLIGHRAAVNDAAFAGDRAVTAGDDGAIMLWSLDDGAALARHETAGEKAMAVAVAPGSTLAATAHWDDRIRLLDPATGEIVVVLEGHAGPVNDVAFSPDGARLYSASADGTVREWDLARWTAGERADGDTAGAPDPRPFASDGWGVTVLATFERGEAERGEADARAPWLAWGGTDGTLRAAPLDAPERAVALRTGTRPVMALAVSPDGTRLAVGDGAGEASVIDIATFAQIAAIARPGPVWGLAFADEAHLYLAGLDDRAFLWRAEPNAPLATAPEAFPRRFHPRGPTESDPMLALGEVQFARKCSVCHTLTPDDANRAGPTLHALFGRPVASLDGYPYSDAMRGLDLVWTAETVGELFRIGPDHYTPGSKMPMQRITDQAERAALIAYLEKATAPR